MTNYVYVPNIVEANGKTVRENNMEKQHTIPIGTLVEVDLDYSEHHGIRLYVSRHSRDCDGSPLYDLSADKNYEPYPEPYAHINRFRLCCGFSDDCLKIVEAGK